MASPDDRSPEARDERGSTLRLVQLIRALLRVYSARIAKERQIAVELRRRAAAKANRLAASHSCLGTGGAAADGEDPELQVIARNLRETDSATRAQLIRALPERVRTIVVDHMVGFASLPELDDGTVQRLLRRVNQTTMARALVDASDDVVRKVLDNLSRHAAAMYREDMGRLAGSDAEGVAEARAAVTRLLREIYQE
jgi:hypothetical protein